MNDPKASAAYHPVDAPETRPDLDALVAEVRYHQADWERIYGQPNYPENLTLAIRVAAALAAERARADHSQLLMAEAWDDGFDAGEGRGNRKIRSNPYRSASAAPTAEQ